jgi:hypothetical protein
VIWNARRVAGHETTKRSSAVRSRAIPSEGTPVQIERELYAASEQRLLERLRAVEDDVESLMRASAASTRPARSRHSSSAAAGVTSSRGARNSRTSSPNELAKR